MALAGTLASISAGGTTIAAVGTATISLNTPAIDVTPIGSTVQSYIAGALGATGSLDIFYDQTSTGHTVLDGYATARSFNTWVLTLTTSQTITGSAMITGYEVTAQAQGVTRATVSLQFDSTITIA
jgi:predicted secreted protein